MNKRTNCYRKKIFLTSSIGFLLLLFIAANSPVASPEELTSQAIQNAREKYLQLKKSPQKQKSRANWQEVINSYKTILDNSPDNSSLDEVLFTLSNIYLSLYRYSKSESDLNDALNSFRQVYARYPKSRYAADAQFMIGEIYYRFKKIVYFAHVSYEKVIEQYPNSDMAPLAKDRLKEMKKTYYPPPTNHRTEEGKASGPEYTNGKGLKTVSAIKHWMNPNYTRIVLNLSGPVNFRDSKITSPDRLFIDLHPARLDSKLKEDGIEINDGLLKKVRAGQNKSDVVRVVLDIDYIERYRIFTLDNPFRLVIDVKGKEDQRSASQRQAQVQAQGQPPRALVSAPAQQPQQPPSQPPSTTTAVTNNTPAHKNPSKKLTLAQQLNLGIGRVVIDPGHGGKDPGAIGASGIREKDIVLDISKKLKQKLEGQLGLKVLLTRDKDVFLPLEERTAIANAKEADLFISIHVNAHKNPGIRGVETYFLNLASSEDAMEVAARENMVSQKKMSDLENILSEILLTSKIDESSRLAQRVQKAVVSDLRRNRVKSSDLGVKQAPFYVLIGAQMPSILVEVAFISNSEEELQLQREEFRDKLAQGILQGIEDYAHQIKIAFQNKTR